MSLTVKIVDPEWLESNRALWAEILADSDAHPVFAGWAWVCSWWETFGATRTPWFLTCWDGSEVVALAFLCSGPAGSVFARRRLELVGQAHCGGDYLDFVVRRSYATQAVNAVAEWLDDRSKARWSWAEFDRVLPQSLVARTAARLSEGMTAKGRRSTVCPVVRIDGAWKEFLNKRFDRKKRHNLERLSRLALERQGVAMRLDSGDSNALRNLETVFRLHAVRKNAQRAGSALAQSSILDFHRRLVPRLAAQGQVTFAMLESEGAAIAAAYCFTAGSSLCYFQTGFDPAGPLKGSGSIMLFELLRHAFERGYAEFDFLQGDEAYKFEWADEVRPLERWQLFRRTAVGQTLQAADLAYHLARRVAGRRVAPALPCFPTVSSEVDGHTDEPVAGRTLGIRNGRAA